MKFFLVIFSIGAFVLFHSHAHAQGVPVISNEDNVAGLVLYKTLQMHQSGTVFYQLCEGGTRENMLDASQPANVNLMKNQLVIRQKIGVFEAAMQKKYFPDAPPADLGAAINGRMQNAVLNEGAAAEAAIDAHGCESQYAKNLQENWALFTQNDPSFISQFIDGMIAVKIEEVNAPDVIEEGASFQLKTIE